MLRLACCAVFALLVTGCASHGVVDNAPGLASDPDQVYSIEALQERYRTDDNALMLAFSGGGTRAAALSYGVLQELRDTPVDRGWRPTPVGRSTQYHVRVRRQLHGGLLRAPW